MKRIRVVEVFLIFFTLGFIWEAISRLLPQYVFAGSFDTIASAVRQITNGDLSDIAGTFVEGVWGFLIALFSAGIFAYLGVKLKYLGRIIFPIMVIWQSLPIVVFLPVLVVLIGTGLYSKLIIIAFFAFLPMYLGFGKYFNHSDDDMRELFATYGARSRQFILKYYLRAHYAELSVAFRASAILAVTGAVVYEYILSGRGAGALLILYRSRYQVDMVFATALWISLFSLLFVGVLHLFELLFIRRIK